MNKAKFHSILSTILLNLGFLTGIWAMFSISPFWGFVYVEIVIISPFVISYLWGKRCSSKDRVCEHSVVQKLSSLMMKKEKETYSLREFLITMTVIVITLFLPQYWLMKNMFFMGLFWSFIGVGILEMRIGVCKGCKNRQCAIHSKRIYLIQ